MIDNKKNKKTRRHYISDYWNMGTSIGLCAAIGIVLGALFKNTVLWLGFGASVGVVLGAITTQRKA